MSFLERWKDELNSSVIEAAKLSPPSPEIDLKYELLVVGVLWPVRGSVQDFDSEAVAAIQALAGDQAKFILRLVQQWGEDRFGVAQQLKAQSLRSSEVGKALNLLIDHFGAFPIFAKQLISQTRLPNPAPASTAAPAISASPPPARVLISYIPEDGAPLAAEVRQHLEAEGIGVWSDLSPLEGQRDWWQQTVGALDQVEFLVWIMTPAALQSELIRKEWRYARQRGVCIYPVLKDPTLNFNLLPRWIRQIHSYNLNLEWPKLINNLKGKCQTPRIPFMAEDLPADYVERPVEFKQLLDNLFDQQRDEALPATVVLHGAGGCGKTTLAKALCHDENIRQVFDNGILWITLTDEPGDLLRYVIDLIEVLSGERPGFSSLDVATSRLVELLADRAILMVIDDVWNRAHLRPFLQGGPRTARLITTRDTTVSPAGAKAIEVGQMQPGEAVHLLGTNLPSGHFPLMRQLANRLGEWPLLLKLVNGILRNYVNRGQKPLLEGISYVNEALNKQGVTAFDAQDPVTRDQAVSQTVELSLELLTPAELTRYRELVIFPEDIPIPMAVVEKLWAVTAGFDDFDTEELCDRLHQLSLLSDLDLTSRQLHLHKVMRDYLAYQYADQLPGLQQRFLEAYRSGVKRWADLGADQLYMWTYLPYHLVGAGQVAELIETVKDLRYLTVKIQTLGVYYAESDLATAEVLAPDETVARLLRRTLSQNSHLLAQGKTLGEIGNTLHSRLAHVPQLADWLADNQTALPQPLLTARHCLPDLPDLTLIRTLRSSASGVLDCAISADGATIVSVTKDNILTAWDVSSGTERFSLIGSEGEIWGCNISADGSTLVFGQSDGTLTLWDVQKEAKRLSWQAHELGIVGCALNADASIVVSTSKDRTLKVWDVESGRHRLTLAGHQRTVTGCDITADGQLIVSCSNDGTLKVWDRETGSERFSLVIRLIDIGIDRLTFFRERDVRFNCAISADGLAIAGTSSTGTLTVWDARTGVERFFISGDKRGVFDCAFTADGSKVAGALGNGTVKVWDAFTGAELLTLGDHTRVVNSCAISADGGLVVSASDDQTLKLWDGYGQKKDLMPASQAGDAHSCAISSDGQVAVSAMANNSLVVWDVYQGTIRSVLKGHTRKVNGCALNADGSILVSASQDQTLIVWDGQTNAKKLVLASHTWAINSCAISADGDLVVSASDDKTLKLWETQTGAEKGTLAEHTRTVSHCAISADGRTVVSASGDGTLKVWDAPTGVKRLTLRGHTAWVNSCAISADGQTIVSASYDKTLKIWDGRSHTERLTLRGHELTITGCSISADGTTIISASRDKTVRVWDSRTGACLATLFLNDPILDCACSADARNIVAASNSGIYFLQLVR
jgi:WD40 repeat protein